jgi:hypothetical protein
MSKVMYTSEVSVLQKTNDKLQNRLVELIKQ